MEIDDIRFADYYRDLAIKSLIRNLSIQSKSFNVALNAIIDIINVAAKSGKMSIAVPCCIYSSEDLKKDGLNASDICNALQSLGFTVTCNSEQFLINW